MDYDSTNDTLEHVEKVREHMQHVIRGLTIRQSLHDKSKLEEPEKSVFDATTPRLAASTYGSDEYKGFLKEMKPALDHHYAHSSHHPEHYCWHCPICDRSYSNKQAPMQERTAGVDGEDHRFCPNCCGNSVIWEAELEYKPDSGVAGMSLLDLIEMLCDWKAATERHNDGSIARSLKINRERFNISDQLQSILENTARELNWID